MRVLIAGAGISGLTLAALLQRHGHVPVLADRRVAGADLGYALALWPHGTRVFHALGIHEEFVTRSQSMTDYVMRDGAGRTLVSAPMPERVTQHGHLGIIPRAELLELLSRAAGDIEIREGTTVQSLTQSNGGAGHSGGVEVTFDDGASDNFDAVIGADGIHSRVRELTLGRIPENDTGWGCFVWWADRSVVDGDDTTERWGAGSFLGTYPCRDKVCVILGARPEDLQPDHPAGRRNRVVDLLRPFGVPVDEFVAHLPSDDEDLFWWRMADVRSPRWVDGRIALVGDAAAAFLPTAGIGASMALESAAALADEMSRTDAQHVHLALQLYERRRRKRVESTQTQSRLLARVMFLPPGPLRRLRDQVARHMSIDQALGSLVNSLAEPI